MAINNNIQEKVNNTFEVIDTLEEVKISPFFKDFGTWPVNPWRIAFIPKDLIRFSIFI